MKASKGDLRTIPPSFSSSCYSSQLDLLRLSTGSPSRVVTACTMLKRMLFRYQGHVSAALVLGGVDKTGAHLYQIYPHGSTDKNPYVTMGSGSLAAMSVFETGFKEDMSEVIIMYLFIYYLFRIHLFIYSFKYLFNYLLPVHSLHFCNTSPHRPKPSSSSRKPSWRVSSTTSAPAPKCRPDHIH